MADNTSVPYAAPATVGSTLPIGRLTIYFGLVYFLQGVCQITTLINQPLRAYLKTQDFTADQTANFFFVTGLPWVIKPVYGLVSDFIPIFGYRRRSYLLLFNLLAAGCFLWMSGVHSVALLMIAGCAVGVGVAAADVVVDALMVETGRETGLAGRFQGVQWVCLYAAALLSSFLSSKLLEWYSPLGAIRVAAFICAAIPLIVAMATWWSVPEKKSKLDAAGMKEAAQGLLAAFLSLRLWFVLIFIALLAANPGVGTPLNYYLTNELKLDDATVAFGDAFFSGGAILGSLIFIALPTKRMSIRVTQAIGIVVAAASMVPFFYMHDKLSFQIANSIWGAGYMVGSLATLSLAAAACPKRAEGFVFAAMMSVSNLAYQYSDVLGGHWYEGFAKHQLWPLMAISIGITLFGLALVPFLPRHISTAGTDEGIGSASDRDRTD